MKCLLLLLYVLSFSPVILCSYNLTTKRTNEEEYYINYDYELTNNVSDNLNLKSDSLILPNPEFVDTKYSADILPNIELPDDSLADTDLRDHDFIDNLMYVYYGSHTRNGSTYGPEIIIIGSVLGCAAQLLTVFCVMLRKNLNNKRETSKMFLHLMVCSCLSNLVFMLGVYATKSSIKCQIIALLLHYLHLLTAFWIFVYCCYIYKRFSKECVPKMKYILSAAYGIPALLTLISFIIAPHSYETKRFCFLSVQRGMILNYMLPISILIAVTTIYSLNGIRKINLELSKLEMTSSAESLNMLKNEIETGDGEKKFDTSPNDEVISLKENKSCLKILCVVQTSYDVVWFIAVIALENVDFSNSMPIFYSIVSSLLNWYIFAKTKSFLPSMSPNVKLTYEKAENMEEDKIITHNMPKATNDSSDNIPLLISCDSNTEMRELRKDSISTISN